MWAYYVSLLPSFGMNYYNVGGDMTGGGINNVPGYAKKITQIKHGNQFIVFTSARAPAGMPYRDGYFKIIPPTKSSEYSATGWSPNAFDPAGEAAAWGYVDLRWNNRAVVAFMDGHSELLGLDELRDPNRWYTTIPVANSSPLARP
jgi:prepilin-type processing-associated H-X9-DG protein